jgi:hypothetical protein
MEQSLAVEATIPQIVFNLRGFYGSLGFIFKSFIPSQINLLCFNTASNTIPHYGIPSSGVTKKKDIKLRL